MNDTERIAEIRTRLEAFARDGEARTTRLGHEVRQAFTSNAPADLSWLLSLIDQREATIQRLEDEVRSLTVAAPPGLERCERCDHNAEDHLDDTGDCLIRHYDCDENELGYCGCSRFVRRHAEPVRSTAPKPPQTPQGEQK